MPDTSTTNYSLIKPEDGGSPDTWGAKTNANWDIVDAKLKELEDVTDQFGAITISAFALTLLDDADASAARTTLELGTAAEKDTGTSGGVVPLLNTANTWSANQTFNTGALNFNTSGQMVVNFGTAIHFQSPGSTNEVSIQSTGLRVWAMTTTASSANVHHDWGLTELFMRSTSSEKFKRDIEPVDPAFSYRVLRDLDPIWYRSNTDLCIYDDPAHSFWGFSAEQAADVDPRLVDWGYDDGDYEHATDAGGNVVRQPKPGAEMKPLGFYYDRMTVHHHVVLRDFLARLEVLEARVRDLLARLEVLEARG